MAVTTVTASLAGVINKNATIQTDWLTDVRNSSNGGVVTPYFSTSPGEAASPTQTAFGVDYEPGRFGGSDEGAIERTFLFFKELNAVIGGLTITAATLKISGSTPQFGNPSSTTQDSIIVGSSAYGGDGNSDLNSDDYSLLSFSNPYSSTLTSWTNTDYNSYTLNASAISDMNNNGYFNCVIINENNDFQGVTPTYNTDTGSVAHVSSTIPVELVLTYEYVATRNSSVTQSVGGLGGNLFAGTPVTFSIDNPLSVSSYFTLETVSNVNGIYDSNSPKNLQGTFTLGAGIIDVISDDYRAGVIVAPGGGDLVFTPTNNVTAATLLPKGMDWSGPIYPPPPKPVPLPTITCPPENGIGLYFAIGGGFFFALAKFTHNGDDSQGLPTYNFPQVITAGSEINYDLNYTSPQWGLSVTTPEAEIDAATSSDLVSSNWTSAGEDLVVSSTTCGYPSAPDFCVVAPGESGNIQINTLPIFPSMNDINTDPVAYFTLFVEFTMIWLPIMGAPAGWSISYDGYVKTISGGSVDSPPTGTFILTSDFDPSDTITITISAGVCSI